MHLGNEETHRERMHPMDKLTYLFKQYDDILGWYHQAESKSTLLHAINGLLVGALNVLVFVGVNRPNERLIYSSALYVLLALTGGCVVSSYLFMLKAVWARHHGGALDLSDREKVWFFGHVGAVQLGNYKKLLDPFNVNDIEATMIAENHILARNVTTKFDALNYATSLTTAAVVLFFIVGIVYATTTVKL
jgi:hypothetical protein